MRFSQLLRQYPTTFSFEFFPPKSPEGEDLLRQRAKALSALKPSFVSVTYGAGGSTRKQTHEVVVEVRQQLDLNVAAHLTCVGHTRDELISILERFREAGVENIVALRGDKPNDEPDFQPPPDGLTYGNELVSMIRQKFGDDFGIAVAGYPEGHPETASKIDDMDHLKRKVEAGADCIVTQLFFDNRDFYDFRERCELIGIKVPIIAGIMPILSRKGILRMAGLSGARIPAKLLKRLQLAGEDDKRLENVGIDWATQQCRDLLDNDVRGIHFYTLNRSGATTEIYRRLGAQSTEDLQQLSAL